jgi:hypothetical protein
MKKYFFILLFVFTFCLFASTEKVFAENASSTTIQINARIMPLIWYSTLSINDGDSIKIYAGIQNNSGFSFTGNAIFYVDDVEIAKRPFTSANNTLMDISANWVANPGSHDVQVKLIAFIAPDWELVSYESDKSSVSITRKITAEVVQEVTRNIINNIVIQIDQIASSSADKIEKLKKTVPVASVASEINVGSIYSSVDTNGEYSNNTTQVSSNSQISKRPTLTASVGLVSDSIKNSSWWTSIYNWLLDALAFIIRHWILSISSLVIMYLGWKVKQWGDR